MLLSETYGAVSLGEIKWKLVLWNWVLYPRYCTITPTNSHVNFYNSIF